MNLLGTLRVALRALLRNKLRSSLTMLGIIIGIAAGIAMVSIGQGASAQMRGWRLTRRDNSWPHASRAGSF